MKENRLAKWWKREWRTCLKAVILACLPLIACLVYCAGRGQSIGRIYLPSSARNDELIYYKQVEAILHCGYPRGYFGFNEGHALKLSFAAWSPVLLLPWVLWGLVFGWNLLSPVLCNIFLLTVAMLLFGLLAKPSWKQTGIIAFLFFLYAPFSWYMLCGMPEIGCMSLLIVFYGAAVWYLRRERGIALGVMFALAGLLTLMRPYLFLFLALPAYFWISRAPGRAAEGGTRPGARRMPAARRRAVLESGAILAAAMGAYAWLNHYLAAEYLEPVFYMDWLTTFWEKGLGEGFRNLFGTLYYSGLEFLRYMKQGAMGGMAAGAIFCCYMVVFCLLVYQSLRDFAALRRAEGEEARELSGQLALEGHLAFSFLGMLFALLLMYKGVRFYDVCKHLLTFLAAGIFVIGRMRTVYLKKAILTGAVFAWFFFYNGAGFAAYQADFSSAAVAERLEDFTRAVEGELVLAGEPTPNYDNTVIWVLADELPSGMVPTGWQYLYSLPAGFGINCCTADYVEEHFDSLKSRYLCVVPGGPVEDRCRGLEYEEIAGNEYAVLYRRY